MQLKFEHGEFTYEGDPTDYHFLEKWETAFDVFNEKKAEAMSAERDSQKIKGFIDAIVEFLDSVFGKGAAKKALGGSTSFDEAFAAFEAACLFARAGVDQIANRANRYLPKAKRAAQ